MTFGKTIRVTLRVGDRTLDVWQEAARRDLAWNLGDWIAGICNARAREVAAELREVNAELRDIAARKPAGPVSVRNGKGGRR